MAKTNYYSYLLACVIMLIVAQFGVATVPLLGGKKMIIGLPMNSGFSKKFVNVRLHPGTNQLDQVTGYSIDIFNATVDYLLRYSGFNVSYEFPPFINERGQSAGTYDELVEQVYNHQYDAVVGDVSIVANRGKYVDFTLPFMDSGVRMLVRVKHDRHINMWIFLRPFSWDLWLSIVMACTFIGAMIRIMERDIDNDEEESEGSSRREQPKGISIVWLPLAQVVLPQGESVAKSCSKFVLVVWLILAFVLMQSYTASLSSILTVDQLQPSNPTSVSDLKRNGENIGYPTGSFIFDKLVDKFKFDKSKLKNVSDMEDYKKALDKGTRKGGVAVIFHEIPFIKMFLKKYGSNYMMVGPHYRIDGLGFAFPINSNLTSYFSRAILNVTQDGNLMEVIERKNFGSGEYDLQDESDHVSISSDAPSPSLTTQSFAGLFMITGISTVLALVLSESHIWRKHMSLAKVYSQKLLLSPSWAKSKQSVDVSTTRGNGGSINKPTGIPESPSRPPNSDKPLETIMHV